MLIFESGTARAAVAPEAGGRLASLSVRGHELLVGPETDPLRWGCYPMVPFAGRIRRGRFSFGGADHELPPTLGLHAMHGYGYTSPWRVVDHQTIAWAFESPWPFEGEASQRFELDDSGLTMTMTATAFERQPLQIGWHPWFRRDIGAGAPAALGFGPAAMYELDGEEIPTGRLVEVPPGQWDNCFTKLEQPPVISWGNQVTLHLESSADHWVIYTEPEHALCVEPQLGAPDLVNRDPVATDAGQSAGIRFRIAWD